MQTGTHAPVSGSMSHICMHPFGGLAIEFSVSCPRTSRTCLVLGTQQLCGRLQGGAEWALGRRDAMALGLSEVPQTARQGDTTAAGRARAALALTAMPKHLPCRDAERSQISQFLEDVLCTGELRLHASIGYWQQQAC